MVWKWLTGNTDDDDDKDKKEPGSGDDALPIENDPSSEEGALYHAEQEITGDGEGEETSEAGYTEVKETLYQPKKKGGLFDWLLGN